MTLYLLLYISCIFIVFEIKPKNWHVSPNYLLHTYVFHFLFLSECCYILSIFLLICIVLTLCMCKIAYLFFNSTQYQIFAFQCILKFLLNEKNVIKDTQSSCFTEKLNTTEKFTDCRIPVIPMWWHFHWINKNLSTKILFLVKKLEPNLIRQFWDVAKLHEMYTCKTKCSCTILS